MIGATAGRRRTSQALDDLGLTTGELADARYVLYVADPDLPLTVSRTSTPLSGMSAQLTELVRTLAERADRHPVTLWVADPGVREAADVPLSGRAALWGLAGVIAAEHPDLWGGVVDLAPGRRAP